jgi:hypothetical protein
MDPLIGRMLGPYRVIARIGEGGMAIVYRAYQESLGRYVAVKVLRGELAHDPEFTTRFRREALAAARLSHPNILPVYDAGTAEGLSYIVMDFAEAGSLKDVIAQGPLPPEQAVDLAAQLADALDYAHRQGLVHRDIKPGNILIAQDGRPLISDFGIARAAFDSMRLTRTSALIGTPEYMAPEQAEGQPLDGRADLYALGIVLYEMLTGRVPFSTNTPAATLYKQVHESPPPVRQLNTLVPAWLEQVVDRALAKRPEDRYQQGRDMAAALRRAAPLLGAASTPPLATLPGAAAIPARQAPLPEPRAAGSAGPRRGLIWALLGVIAVLLLALVAGSVYLLAGGADGAAGQDTPLPTMAIVEAARLPPAVAIVAPLNGTAWQPGQDVVVQSQATDDRGVMRVELWVDGLLVRSDASPQPSGQTPFLVVQPWRAGGVGSHTLIARAYDADGGMSDSAPLLISVQEPGPTPVAATPTSTSEPTAEATAEPTVEVLPSPPPPATDTPAPTRTPTRTPTATPACSAAVDPTLANAWSQARLGCPTGPAAIVWSAWEPFERGNMLWRQDTDWAYVLHWQNGSNPAAGDWMTGGNPWKWDGSFPDGHGLTPPPGLYEPIRGFGFVWYNYLGGPAAPIGWATDQEKGFCARIQAFEQGTIVRSTKLESCDGNFNRGREPTFNHFLWALYQDGSWQGFTP